MENHRVTDPITSPSPTASWNIGESTPLQGRDEILVASRYIEARAERAVRVVGMDHRGPLSLMDIINTEAIGMTFDLVLLHISQPDSSAAHRVLST